jgi:hypothetical protein
MTASRRDPRIEFARQNGVRRQRLAHFHERTDDIDAHLFRAWAVENGRGHDRATLGEDHLPILSMFSPLLASSPIRRNSAAANGRPTWAWYTLCNPSPLARSGEYICGSRLRSSRKPASIFLPAARQITPSRFSGRARPIAGKALRHFAILLFHDFRLRIFTVPFDASNSSASISSTVGSADCICVGSARVSS